MHESDHHKDRRPVLILVDCPVSVQLPLVWGILADLDLIWFRQEMRNRLKQPLHLGLLKSGDLLG